MAILERNEYYKGNLVFGSGRTGTISKTNCFSQHGFTKVVEGYQPALNNDLGYLVENDHERHYFSRDIVGEHEALLFRCIVCQKEFLAEKKFKIYFVSDIDRRTICGPCKENYIGGKVENE